MQIKHIYKQQPIRVAWLSLVFGLSLLVGGQAFYKNVINVGAVPGFNSEVDPNVIPMINGFTSLPSSTIQENDQKAIQINNSATAAQITDAQSTHRYPASLATQNRISISRSFGPLQQELLDAVAAGEVNDVVDLVNQRQHILELDDYWASSDGAKDVFQFQRPFCTSRGTVASQIIKHAADDTSIYGNPGDPCSLAFPSGHTKYAYVEGVALATMVPELAPQIMARTAEVSNNRIILGVHYPLDTMASRAIATRMVAARWHDDAWRPRLEAAKTQLRTALENRCGDTIANCVANGSAEAYMPTQQALDYSTYTLTYDFTKVGTAGQAFAAPDYAYELLSATSPSKTPAELNAILASTAIDSGYPLDTTGTSAGSGNIGWTRIDLSRALQAAIQDVTPPADTTDPTVSLTSPANNAVLSGTVTLAATASDNVGVTRVDFLVDGVVVGTDSSSPYSLNLDTSSLSNSSHIIVAKAYDATSNEGTSSAVNITVNNQPAGPEPLVFDLTGSVKSTFTINGTCLDSISNQRIVATPVELADSTVLIGAGFSINCASGGQQSDVTIDLDKTYDTDKLKVFKQTNGTVADITSDTVISSKLINGSSVTSIAYSLVDGGFGDEDGLANSQIVDPVFVTLASSTVDPVDPSDPADGSGDTGNNQPATLAETGEGLWIYLIISTLAISASAVYVWKHKQQTN